MKLKSSVTPVALLVAGSFGSAAHATTVYVDNGDYTPPPFMDGVPFSSVDITLAGASSPQYTFSNSIVSKYYLQGNDGATIAYPGASTYVSGLQTGAWDGTGTDGDYGIRFSANGTDYKGFATLIDNGTVIDKITYEVAGVPEPATWAMMVLGLGLAGGALRRSKRRQAALATA